MWGVNQGSYARPAIDQAWTYIESIDNDDSHAGGVPMVLRERCESVSCEDD